MKNKNSRSDYFWKFAVLALIVLLGVQSFLMYRSFSVQNGAVGTERKPEIDSAGSNTAHIPPMPNLNVNVMPGRQGINPGRIYNQNLISSLNNALANHGVQANPNSGRQRLKQSPGANINIQFPGTAGPAAPMHDIDRMMAMMDRMMANSFGGRSMPGGGRGPSRLLSGGGTLGNMASVKSDKDKYIITMNIPGLDKSEIKTEINNDMLTVSGLKREQVNNTGAGMNSYSQSCSSFQTSMNLPGAVDAEKMKVDYKNGILTIVAPKA